MQENPPQPQLYCISKEDDVSTDLRLPHYMFYMIKRVNEINISQFI